MKTRLALFLVIAVPMFAAPAKKSSPIASATAVKATPAVDPTAKLEAAAVAKVKSYFADQKPVGDANTGIADVKVGSGAVSPVPGWKNRYHTAGMVTVTIVSRGTRSQSVRSYDVLSELTEKGAVNVLDITVR